MVKVSKQLDTSMREEFEKLLAKYKDVFGWIYKDMKGIDPRFHQQSN